MKPLLRRPLASDSDESSFPWDRGPLRSPGSPQEHDRALIPRLEWDRVAKHLPVRRRIQIEINGRLVGSPDFVADAPVEFAIGWAFINRFFSTPSQLGRVTSSLQRISIMVQGGVDLERHPGAVDGSTGIPIGQLMSDDPECERSGRTPRAVPFIDDLDMLSLSERAFRQFDADGASIGYVHAALATDDDVVCIARDLNTDAAAAKILGWAMRGRCDVDCSTLVVRGIVDGPLSDAAHRAGFPIIVTDAVPTRSAVESAGATCTSIVGLARTHRCAMFVDGGHIASAS